MIPLKQVAASTVGRKFVMALSGVFLVLFILLHLAGNLQLLVPGTAGAELFNHYAAKFKSLGPFFYVAEIGIFALFLLHAVLGYVLWRKSADARQMDYAVAETKGGDSRWNLSSTHMMLLGVVLLVFVVVHVLQFRYEWSPLMPSAKQYQTVLDGKTVVDLHAIVVDTFRNPWWVLFYVGTMVFLGLHVRHGIWSMFQSLGVMPKLYSRCIYVTGGVVAVLLAVGFLVLPIYLYLTHL